MNRARRAPPASTQKNFVSGGVYDPNTSIKKQNNLSQQNTPQKIQQQPQQQSPAMVEQHQAEPIQKPQIVKPLEPPPENPFKDSALTLDTSDLIDANGKVKFKNIFMSRKKASVRAKEKRIRQNRRLRKTIIPKNALMALNELKGVAVSDFTINSNPGGGFIALVTVNNNQYEGRGNSKVAAKNNACEKALRDYIIAKMRENPRTAKNASCNNSVCNEPMDTSDGNEEGNDAANGDGEDADDVPMVNLASFAIYKLFSEWENEGFVIPEMHPATTGGTSDTEGGAVPAGPKEPKKAPIRNELPQNWEAMHPASLLCIMRPGVIYADRGCSGEKPNVMQSLAVTVDDQEFVAFGRSKKFARRNVAALACNTLFNTNFEMDVKQEPAAPAAI